MASSSSNNQPKPTRVVLPRLLLCISTLVTLGAVHFIFSPRVASPASTSDSVFATAWLQTSSGDEQLYGYDDVVGGDYNDITTNWTSSNDVAAVVWDDFVNCGNGIMAPTCSRCPRGNGTSWCRGECVWSSFGSSEGVGDGVCQPFGRTQCLNSGFSPLNSISVWTMLTEDEKGHVSGAVKLGQSLLRHNSHVPLDLVVMELRSNRLSDATWNRLRSVGWQRCVVQRIASPLHEEEMAGPLFDSLAKVHVWGMTAYKTLLYLEPETLVRNSLDQLLQTDLGEKQIGASRDYSEGRWLSTFDDGIFLIYPNGTEYQRLLRLVDPWMAESGFLNMVYKQEWFDIGFEHNADVEIVHQHGSFWNSHKNDIRIVHYTFHKPWKCSDECGTPCSWWWEDSAGDDDAVEGIVTCPNNTKTSKHKVNVIKVISGADAPVHVSDTGPLSVMAMITMALLALQFCAQPPLTRRFLDSRANKKAIAMVEESFKLTLATTFFFSCGKDVVKSELDDWTLRSSLGLAGLPAVLYATQGVLNYLAFQNTDSVTYNGLNQTKTLSAALWCFLLMGKRQSMLQMVALTILLFSTLLFQGTISVSSLCKKKIESDYNYRKLENGDTKEMDVTAHSPKKFQGDDNYIKSENGGTNESKDSGGKEKIEGGNNNGKVENGSTNVTKENKDTDKIDDNAGHNSFSKGILPCMAAAFISGLAGALSQKGVQMAGGKGRSPYLYTMELSVYSSMSLLTSILASKKDRRLFSEKGGIFQYWTPYSVIPILVRALGGVIIALVHLHAGATRKGFALILGLIMTGVTQSVIEGELLSKDQLLAMAMVILSSYLHMSYPPKTA
mmetsp:Transcript_27852/g.58830  ORF Transcript_27852/g.58830 Transcript_27852/m.58830 type:complete len:837 (+) Transcript_27852:51-2561(+)